MNEKEIIKKMSLKTKNIEQTELFIQEYIREYKRICEIQNPRAALSSTMWNDDITKTRDVNTITDMSTIRSDYFAIVSSEPK